MKKLLFSCLMLVMASCAMAQAPRLAPLLDTNTNAATAYLTTPLVNGNVGNYSFQYVGIKISGTVAGTVKLYGSLDGTNYTQVGTDSLALTNVTTNTKIWEITNQKRMKYRLEIVTTGTVALQNKGYYINR